MELLLETFDVGAPGSGGRDDRAAAGREERQHPAGPLRRGRRLHAGRHDEGPADPLQPAEQRRQVHRERRGRLEAVRVSARRSGSGFASRVHDTGIGMTDGAGRQAVPGLHAGGCLDHAQVRRHRPGPGHQPPLLRDDGRQHRRRERRSGAVRRSRIELPGEGGARLRGVGCATTSRR